MTARNAPRCRDRSGSGWLRRLALATTALVACVGTDVGRAADAPSTARPSILPPEDAVPPAYLAGTVRPPEPTGAPRLRHLTLTLSGVAYHGWEAGPGMSRVTMPVRLDDVDDVLRSITAAAGSRLVSIDLPGPDDATSAFDALPFGPADLTSPVALLNALRGNDVTIVSVGSGSLLVSGRLVFAEHETEPVPGAKLSVERTRVTIATSHGLAQFVLEYAGELTFDDPTLNARIGAALESMRRRTNAEIREVAIDATPAPDGIIHLTTVTKAPLWKTAYRLALPPGSHGTAHLSGLAIVENTDAGDWHDVDVTLQSGNPVAIRQAIYRYAEVERPEAAVDQQRHDLPPIDQRPVPASALAMKMMVPGGAVGALGAAGVGKAVSGMAMPAPAAAPAPAMDTATSADGAAAEPSEPPAPPPEPATGVGESFHLRTPVTLAAGRSAGLPFIEADVPFERVDRLGFRETHPMQSVKVTNDTDASWPGGAVSTQDDAGFAGDARLPALPRGQARMLDFATDLAVEAHWNETARSRRLVGYKVAGGLATISLSLRTTTTVDLAGAAARHDTSGASSDPTTVVIEWPREEGTKASVHGATMDDPTDSAWRARIALSAGGAAAVRIDVDRPLLQSVRLVNAATVLAGLEGQDLDGLSPATLDALHRIAALQQARIEAEAEVTRAGAARNEAVADQQRIRQNVQALSGADPERSRYVAQLGQAESVIEKATARLAQAHAAVQEAEARLTIAVAMLTVE